jgi:hypothetical protein
VPAHLRIGHGREGGGGRDRGATDCGKAGAGEDGGEAEATAQVADEGVGGTEQLAAHARRGDECAHQQEHRDHAECVVGHRAHRRLADQLQRGPRADDHAKAGDADEAHGHADRHAQEHQREQHDEADDGDGVGAEIEGHRTVSSAAGRVIRR